MKSLQINRTCSDHLPTVPYNPESKLLSLSQIRQVSKSVDSKIDLFKDLSEINKKLEQIINCVQLQNDVLLEHANSLKSEINDCRDTIQFLNARKEAINSIYARLEIENKLHNNLKLEPSTTLTIDTTIEYLKSQPIFLDAFFTNKLNDDIYYILQNLSPDVRKIFVEYSFHQLERISQCFEICFELGKNIRFDTFIDLLSIYVSKLFSSNMVYIFQINSSTGEYFCNFKSKNLTISLKNSSSLISSTIKSQAIVFYTNPSKEVDFSPSLDPLFNPDNEPILFIPIKSEAMILVIHKDKSSLSFCNEDVYIAKLFECIIHPLFQYHNHHLKIEKEKKLCEIIQQFKNDLSEKDHFSSLLPFLSHSFKKIINFEEIRIFVVKTNDIILTFSLNKGKLVESKYDMIGIPNFVIKNKYHFTVDFLNATEVPCYSEEIDGWAKDKPFGAFPLFLNKEKVAAVLCLTSKNKFENSHLEFLLSVSPLLSLIISRCVQNTERLSSEEASETINKYPLTVSKLTFENLQQEKSIFTILRQIQQGTKAEMICAYLLDQSSNDDNKKDDVFVRLMSLKGEEIVNGDFVNIEFVKFVYESENPINESDPSRLSLFKPPEGIKVDSIMAVANKKDDEKKIVVICINSKSNSGRFDPQYHLYLSSFSSLITCAIMIRKKDEEINEQKQQAAVLESTFSDCNEAMQYPNPLLALIQSILKRIQMDNFMLLRYKPLSRSYECILASDEVKRATVFPENNQLLEKLNKLSKSTKIEKSSINDDNSILELFPSFSVLAVEPVNSGLLLLCSGNSIHPNFTSYFDAYLPFLKSLYRNFLLTSQKVAAPFSEINKIDLKKSALTDSDVSSRLFAVTKLNDAQKIEVILKMFTKCDLLTIMETNIEEMTKFLFIVRDKYRDIPYHNWNHAVDTIQFAFRSIERGRLRKFLRPRHIIAILLACLMHDIDHSGFDTSFHANTKSPLFFTYGDDSTLEKHHLCVATKILQESLITRKKTLYKDQIFWSIFVNSIMATDMTKHFEYIEKFQELRNSFNSSNEKDLLLLAQLIIKCANVANCTRPFDVTFQMAKSLQKEFLIQVEKEKKLNVNVHKTEKNEYFDMSGNLDKFEINFINSIAKPLLTILGSIAPELPDYVIQMEDNKKQWNEYRIKPSSKT